MNRLFVFTPQKAAAIVEEEEDKVMISHNARSLASINILNSTVHTDLTQIIKHKLIFICKSELLSKQSLFSLQ